MEDFIFANQAATIRSSYHWNEMLIYRPFISSSESALNQGSQHDSFPSPARSPIHALEICTNAARSCARIYKDRLRHGVSNVPNVVNLSQISAGILVLTFWDLKSQQRMQHSNNRGLSDSSLVQRMKNIRADISIFLELLEWAEPKWDYAAAFLYV